MTVWHRGPVSPRGEDIVTISPARYVLLKHLSEYEVSRQVACLLGRDSAAEPVSEPCLLARMGRGPQRARLRKMERRHWQDRRLSPGRSSRYLGILRSSGQYRALRPHVVRDTPFGIPNNVGLKSGELTSRIHWRECRIMCGLDC